MEVHFVSKTSLVKPLPNAFHASLNADQLGHKEGALLEISSNLSRPTLLHHLLQSHQLLLKAGQRVRVKEREC